METSHQIYKNYRINGKINSNKQVGDNVSHWLTLTQRQIITKAVAVPVRIYVTSSASGIASHLKVVIFMYVYAMMKTSHLIEKK